MLAGPHGLLTLQGHICDTCSMYIQKSAKSKYKNVKQTYDGYSYDSRLEAQKAHELDLLVKAGEIVEWERQFKVSIEYDGKKICDYYCDFRALLPDGSYELIEIKGMETAVYRLKRKLLEIMWLPEHLDHVYIVEKQQSWRNYRKK